MTFSYWTQRQPKRITDIECLDEACDWAGSTLDQCRRHVASTGHHVRAHETQTIDIKPHNDQRPYGSGAPR